MIEDIGLLKKDTSQSCIFDFPDRPDRPVPPIDPSNEYPYEPILDWPPFLPINPTPGQDPIPGSDPHPRPVSNPGSVEADAILFKLIPDNLTLGYVLVFLPFQMQPYQSYEYEKIVGGAGAVVSDNGIYGSSSPTEENLTDTTVFALWNLKGLTADVTGQFKVYNPRNVLINLHLEFTTYKFHGAIVESRPDPMQPWGFWTVGGIDSKRRYYHDFVFPAGDYPPGAPTATMIFAEFTYHHATGIVDFTWLV